MKAIVLTRQPRSHRDGQQDVTGGTKVNGIAEAQRNKQIVWSQPQ